jgi:hypothetical protein
MRKRRRLTVEQVDAAQHAGQPKNEQNDQQETKNPAKSYSTIPIVAIIPPPPNSSRSTTMINNKLIIVISSLQRFCARTALRHLTQQRN